jgi:hypothetical protein
MEDFEKFQRGAVGYFLRRVNPSNGLIADNSQEGSPCSIAATGFGLSAYVVAAERGILTRNEAIECTLKALRFFRDSPQGEEADATGYKGFYYHFLDMQSGRRIWQCELSMIDTALLIAGVLTSGVYFSKANELECEIREIAKFLYERIDWQWATDGGHVLRMGWRPGAGFLSYGWEGYSEAMLLYILGLGSPTYPIAKKSYEAWMRTFQWENLYDIDFLFAGPLFIHQMTQIWVDLRGIQDSFMREKGSDYFENSRRAIQVQQQYSLRNPMRFKGYNKDSWGITAGLGPGFLKQPHYGNVDRQFFEYVARGIPYGPDDGTLAPWAILASLPFAAESASDALQHLLQTYPKILTAEGLLTSFNPSFEIADALHEPWYSPKLYGIDQGPVALMIENYSSGLFWNLMRKNPAFMSGLHRAGFRKSSGRINTL